MCAVFTFQNCLNNEFTSLIYGSILTCVLEIVLTSSFLLLNVYLRNQLVFVMEFH